jgi:septal ring factor EnvC (AmiA/AmiB activator)
MPSFTDTALLRAQLNEATTRIRELHDRINTLDETNAQLTHELEQAHAYIADLQQNEIATFAKVPHSPGPAT